jgi:hypothetical protein
MSKENIIFFEKLGCGWVVDAAVILRITPEHLRGESVSERRLFEHVYWDGPDGKDLLR